MISNGERRSKERGVYCKFNPRRLCTSAGDLVENCGKGSALVRTKTREATKGGLTFLVSNFREVGSLDFGGDTIEGSTQSIL